MADRAPHDVQPVPAAESPFAAGPTGRGAAPADSGVQDHLAAETLDVWYGGRRYPAAPVVRGAAYELFARTPEPGFLPNPRPGAQWPFRRFVHTTHAMPVSAPARPDDPIELPLRMPVSPSWTYETVHRLSQIPPDRCDPGPVALITAIRRTATITRGTGMMKVLCPRQVAGYLTGGSLTGFCHREYDLAHLRTPAELAPLNGSPEIGDVVFALRWKAVDPLDYAIPLATAARPADPSEVDLTGLLVMPPSSRIGPQVIGTGFTPSGRHLVPEWVTADLADLPLPVGANITAYTSDGSQVVLYTYQPDQHAWVRMCGGQWRHLLEPIPLRGQRGQEFFPISTAPGRLIGRYQGRMVEAIADPPGVFRSVAKARATRHPVDAVVRRVRYLQWRDALCTIVGEQPSWRHLRLCAPNPQDVERLGAEPVDRGVYEVWAPAEETTDWRDVDLTYSLDRAAAPG